MHASYALSFTRWTALAVCLLLAAAPAQAQSLFAPAPAGKTLAPAQVEIAAEVATRPTALSTETVAVVEAGRLVDASELTLALSPGLTVTARRATRSTRRVGETAWSGRIGDTAGTVSLTAFPDGSVAGLVQVVETSGVRTFEVISLGDGLSLIVEIDQSRFPQDVHDDLGDGGSAEAHTAHTEAADLDLHAQLLDAATAASAGSAGMLSDPVIDILVVYTSAASSGISSHIASAITTTNNTLTNSQINTSLNLVHQAYVNYSESGRSFSTIVNHLAGTSDGYMDNVHSLRDQYGADMVMLITNGASSGCGRANVIRATSKHQAYAASEKSCSVANLTFPHEVGHLIGTRHNPEADPSTSPYPYGHGYNYIPGGWRTVMSYNSSPSTDRIAFWSNPNVLYSPADGYMGTTHTHDNARVWNERAATVAAFNSVPPANPLVVSAIEGQEFVSAKGNYTYYAIHQGGTGTTSYQWYYRYVGNSTWNPTGSNSSTHTRFVSPYGSDLELRVDVTRGSESGSGYITVYMYSGGGGGGGGCLDGPCLGGSGGTASAEEQPQTGDAADDAPGTLGDAQAEAAFGLDAAYPNPTTGALTVPVRATGETAVTVALYDALGREALRADRGLARGEQTVTLDVSGLPAGVYVLRATSGAEVATQRIVVTR